MGAGAAYSTPSDMARYLAALMCRGANEYGSVLKPATLASMFAPQYQPHPRIPGMGLAFWRRDAGGHRLVEHIGVLPGFDSEILVAPDDGFGVMAFTNGTHGGTGWLGTELSTLVNRLLGVPDEVIRTNVPQLPEVWGDLWVVLPSRPAHRCSSESHVRRWGGGVRPPWPAVHPDAESDTGPL